MSSLDFDGKADAYLEWAQHTSFVFTHIGPLGETGLLVEAANGHIAAHEEMLEQESRLDPLTFLTARRLELATPIAKPDKIILSDNPWESIFKIKTVLGVIDDGCPFARPSLMSGQRVELLWQQGAWGTQGAQWNAGKLKEEYEQTGQDDAATYEKLGLKNLRRRATHGAHVMDVFAGPVPPRSRVSPSRMKGEGEDGSAYLPPSWTPATDVASRAPIVFVQLPQAAIEDPTGRWLGRYVLDGVDFILEAAKKLTNQAGGVVLQAAEGSAKPTPQVVINISWGPQTGPHDGSSLLEKALSQRVQQAAAQQLTLQLALASGNSHEARAHAQWLVNSGCKGLPWHAMPDADHPQFLEVWWPEKTVIDQAQITVTAPDGRTADNISDGKGQHGVFEGSDGWWLVVVPHPGTAGNRQMALLALAPTRVDAGHASAPHGRWTVTVEKDAQRTGSQLAHAYAARNSANMGGRRRAQDGYLFDPLYEETRHGRWPRREPPESLVRREGTLSGLATGTNTQVTGGYVLAGGPTTDPLPARYSSSGAQTVSGRWPDWSQPSDESVFLHGIRAGGVRDGTSVRLVGTSTAAPQLARKLANGTAPVARSDAGSATPAPPPPAPAPAPTGPRLGNPLPMKRDTLS